MSLTTLGELVAVGALFGAAAIHVVRLELHLPEFRMIQAEVLYEKCIRECHEVCAANGVPITKTPGDERVCVCDHCRKYLEGD